MQDHVKRIRPVRVRELAFYAKELPSDEEAIEWIAWAKDHEGKRHSHQRRLRRVVLAESARRLRGIQLRSFRSFHALFEAVQETIGPIRGIGELMVYDTSLHLGAFLDLWPDRVYLHAGTRKGARALALPTRDGSLDPHALPAELAVLEPYEVEDFLCIYKDRLSPSRSAAA